MHDAQRLKFHEFDPGRPLPHLNTAPQQEQYVRTYLRDLGVEAILEEPHYFDRDYLSEFKGYYAASARGYPNVCRRLHFFSVPVPRRKLRRALNGSDRTLNNLREAYLGFCVVRPLPTSPFGKTVLRWYPERRPEFPRVTESRRTYECQVAGISFSVEGLAWQQQDTSVAACATVALWSMLHSSAFMESHAVPTTYEITEAANETLGYGRRAFPSRGLTADQLGSLYRRAYRLGFAFHKIHEQFINAPPQGPRAVSTGLSLRFVELNDYLGDELSEILDSVGKNDVLGKARLQLIEQIPPLSKHLGLIRIASDGEPVVDFVLDTTEIARASRCFCHLVFDRRVEPILNQMETLRGGYAEESGVRIEAC